jgi:catechol-2,3-dioxygenase
LDTSKQVGDPDHLKVFASADAAEAWFAENDPEGGAFEVIADQPAEESNGWRNQ